MRTAQNAEAIGVWCAWGYHPKPNDPEPELSALSPGELIGILSRAASGQTKG